MQKRDRAACSASCDGFTETGDTEWQLRQPTPIKLPCCCNNAVVGKPVAALTTATAGTDAAASSAAATANAAASAGTITAAAVHAAALLATELQDRLPHMISWASFFPASVFLTPRITVAPCSAGTGSNTAAKHEQPAYCSTSS